MEEREIMKFKDEDGNTVEFEPVAEIYDDEKKYLILSPIDGSEDDAFVFRVDLENEVEVLNLVEDDEEFLRVKKEYKKLLYNEK